MDQLFDRKTDSFFGPLRHLGYVLLLAGLAVGSSPWWWGNTIDLTQALAAGVLLVLLGLLFKFTHHGFQLDFRHRRVREYLSMFGLKTGKWAPLPAFTRVVLSSHLRPAHDHDHDHDHGHSHDEQPDPLVLWYTIGLHSFSEEPDYELRTDSREDALNTVRLLANRLEIRVENLTSF